MNSKSTTTRGVRTVDLHLNHDTKHNLINYSTVGRELSQLIKLVI